MGSSKNTKAGADWQDVLRRNMESYGEAEPDGLWSAVASGLKSSAGAGASASAGASGSRAGASSSRAGAFGSGAGASGSHAGASAVIRRRRRYYYGAGAFAIAAAAIALFLIFPLPGRLSPVASEAVALAESPLDLSGNLPAAGAAGLPAAGVDELPAAGAAELPAAEDVGSLFDVASSAVNNPASKSASSPASESAPVPTSASSAASSTVSQGNAASTLASQSGDLPPVVSVDESEPDCVENPSTAADAAGGVGVGEGASAALELEEFLLELETREAKRRPGRTRLAVAVSGAVGTSSSSSSGYDAFYGSSVPKSFNSPTAGSPASQHFSAVLLENNNRSVKSDRRFYQPVALGLSFARDIGQRLYVQSGLEYSCLISELVSGSESTHYDTRQSVHMLGVPLGLGVHLLDNQLFELNLSAGGMLEKALYARSVTRFVLEGKEPVSTSERLGDDPLYWSVNASVSALYKISDKLGIYFEPGLSYHFRNGSFVETIYSARPLNLQITLGLRFTL